MTLKGVHELRNLRTSKLRRSEDVVKYGLPLVEQGRGLGDEYYVVLEQVFIACLDTQDVENAKRILAILEGKFTEKSSRVQGLRGMLCEAEGQYARAKEIYDGILKEKPMDPFAKKRLVCIHKAKNDYPRAVAALNEYLRLFMNDVDAWQELAELYLHMNLYKNAAFCYEELLLTTPHNPLYSIKYASILYTIGDYDSLILARKYFCFAHELLPENTRALLGIVQTCVAVAAHGGADRRGKRTDDDLNEKTYKYARGKLGGRFALPPLPTK